MKYILALLAIGITFSCAEENADTNTYKGLFLVYDGNAVLEVDDQMYAITMDDMTQELAEKAKNWQKTEYDYVPVTIEAVSEAKAANVEAWDSILTIKKIIEVSPTSVGPDIQIEETNE